MGMKFIFVWLVMLASFLGCHIWGAVSSWKPTGYPKEIPGLDISDRLLLPSPQDHKSEANHIKEYGKFDLCEYGPCGNAGECITVPGGFICSCPPGWAGKLCQHSDVIHDDHAIAKRTATGTCTVDPIDVVFVLDSTGSIGSAGFQNELDFVQEFTNLVTIGRDAFHIGVVQFGHNTFRATIEFDLIRYSDKASIISAVQSITFQSGGIDYIDAGLQSAKDVLDRTARSNSVKYVVLLTDGGSRDQSATLAIAGLLKSSYTSLRLYVIGIGIRAPSLHLQQVASDPSYFLYVNQPADLVSFVNSAVSITCKDIKDCASSPCQNGATCVTTASGYTCTCRHGFDGVRCQNDINECDSLPCYNGGSCTNTIGSYLCNCAEGWTGRNCFDDINECDSSPCANGGNCTNTPGSYFCHCHIGWEGKNCTNDINECDGVPCQNDGNCTNTMGSYFCTCLNGWQGKNCSEDINECETFPCENSGECINIDGSYICDCLQGFGGKNCSYVFPWFIAIFILLTVAVLSTCLVIAGCVRRKNKERMNNKVTDSTASMSCETPYVFNADAGKHGSLGPLRPAPPPLNRIFIKC